MERFLGYIIKCKSNAYKSMFRRKKQENIFLAALFLRVMKK